MKKTEKHVEARKSSQLKTMLRMLTLGLILFICSPSPMRANADYAQTKVSIRLNNTTIAKVLSEIEKTTDFSVIYTSKDLNLADKVSINMEGKTADEILTQVFDGKGIKHEVKGKHIIVYKEGHHPSNDEILIAQAKQQQSQKVTGHIVDQHNEPIIGASVIEKGTTNGVSTNLDGAFSLNITSKDASIDYQWE